MQRSPSFVLLDTDSSSSEHEEFIEISPSIPDESASTSIGLAFDASEPEKTSASESFSKVINNDQDSCSTSTDECSDVAELFSVCRKNFDVSKTLSLSPEEVSTDLIRGADDLDPRSESKIDDSSICDEGVPAETIETLSLKGTEPVQNPSIDQETNMETTEGRIAASGVQMNGNLNTNFFRRIFNMVTEINEIAKHINSTSKLFALCALLLAILIPTTTICMISPQHTVEEPDFTLPRKLEFEASTSELAKCKSTLNWRQEKIEQMETKLEKIKATLIESQNNLGECRRSLSDHQEKYTKCSTTLKNTKKMLKLKDDLYEDSRNKVFELQEKIINCQQEGASDHRPFIQKAFDKIFGYPADRKFRERRGKWRN